MTTVTKRRAAPAAPVPSFPPRSSQGIRQPRWTGFLTMGVLLLCLVYFALPVFWVLVAATKNAGDLFGSFGLWFSHPRLLSNLKGTFSYDNGIYGRWLFNSVLYSGVSALVATFVSAAAGYALAKFEFRGREAVYAIILAGVMVPGTATALPLYLMFSSAHLNNTYLSVLLPSFLSPFGVFLCRVYARAAVPDEVLDAARCDGAGEFRVFTTVALRMMVPALVTVFLFHFVGVWNNYLLPLLMLANDKLYPVTLGLVQWNGDTQRIPELYPLTVMGAAISVVLLGAAILSLQRFWIAGIATGSIR